MGVDSGGRQSIADDDRKLARRSGTIRQRRGGTSIEVASQIRPAQIPYLTRVLLRTQRMMKAAAYMKEHEASQLERPAVPSQALEAS